MEEYSDLIDSSGSDGAANPSKYPFLSSLNLDQDVTKRLTLHLDRLVQGDSSVFVSAIGKEHNPASVLDSWSRIFESKVSKLNQPLIELELSNKDKFSPRSIALPWKERIPSIQAYYAGGKRSLSFDIYKDMPKASKGSLRPLSIDEALKVLKNSTNSGLPYYVKKGVIKDRTKRKLQSLLLRRDPCILFTRTQEAGKTRNVWGYPCADTLEEMRYYRPLLGLQSKVSWRSALKGPDEVSKSVTKIILNALEEGKVLVSGDISSFDANVIPDLIDASFYYIKNFFQYNERAGIDRICDRFKTIGLVTPSGVVEGVHGVPSGSTFTNEVDSIVQYLILKSLGYSEDCFQVQGDDLLISLYLDEVPKLKDRYESSYLPLNEEKSKIARDHCIFLQNLYHVDYIKKGIIGGIYPTYRALNRILYQERWSDFEDFGLEGIDYYSIRTIAILENCKHHPLFRDLVEFVYNLDKYSLKFTKKAIKKYDAMLNDSSGVGGFLYNQYSDNVRGINNFETVKIIRELDKR